MEAQNICLMLGFYLHDEISRYIKNYIAVARDFLRINFCYHVREIFPLLIAEYVI